MDSLYFFFYTIYISTSGVFHIEMATEADKAVENGMRTGDYTLDAYMEEAWQYE